MELYFQDYFKFGITDIKLVRIELFKCNILKEHVLIYINATFQVLRCLSFTLEVSKINYFNGFLKVCKTFEGIFAPSAMLKTNFINKF